MLNSGTMSHDTKTVILDGSYAANKIALMYYDHTVDSGFGRNSVEQELNNLYHELCRMFPQYHIRFERSDLGELVVFMVGPYTARLRFSIARDGNIIYFNVFRIGSYGRRFNIWEAPVDHRGIPAPSLLNCLI